MANIGGSSNDSTGNSVVRRAMQDRLDDALDRVEELKVKYYDAMSDGDREKANKIEATILRQQREIRMLEANMRSLGKAYKAPSNTDVVDPHPLSAMIRG